MMNPKHPFFLSAMLLVAPAAFGQTVRNNTTIYGGFGALSSYSPFSGITIPGDQADSTSGSWSGSVSGLQADMVPGNAAVTIPGSSVPTISGSSADSVSGTQAQRVS